MGVSAIKERLRNAAFPVPRRLESNFATLTAEQRNLIEDSLMANYFIDFPPGYPETPTGRSDLNDHLVRRNAIMRRRMIPWLDEQVSLQRARILEIGCGTGSATVAFAEQGADVTALELFEVHMRVARTRIEAHGLEATFVCGNAVDLDTLFAGEQFDIVVFLESLEHMTNVERLTALRNAWALTRSGGIMVITGAPNRLWLYDRHTAQMPFFMWLPDDLAYRYSSRSARSVFKDRFHDQNMSDMEDFLRWGRGVSFHDIELALNVSIDELDICPSMLMHNHRKNPALGAAWAVSLDGRYSRLLRKIMPDLERAFAEPSLNVPIRKR